MVKITEINFKLCYLGGFQDQKELLKAKFTLNTNVYNK